MAKKRENSPNLPSIAENYDGSWNSPPKAGVDAALAATLKEFDYKGPKNYPPPHVTEDLLRRTAARVHAAATRQTQVFH